MKKEVFNIVGMIINNDWFFNIFLDYYKIIQIDQKFYFIWFMFYVCMHLLFILFYVHYLLM